MKKTLACILVLTFVFSCSIPALALGDAGISQEEAIQKIKDLIDTSSYDRFNINYNEYDNGRKVWELSWSKTQAPYGSLNASIDAKTGNILSINLYKGYDPNRKTSPIPKYSEEEARQIAENFAKKLQPEEFAKTRLSEDTTPIYPLTGSVYRDSYYFNFVRTEKGIPVEGNGINIRVDAHTGDIENYSFIWSWEPLPSPEKIISLEDAQQVFKDEIGLKLIYRRYYDYYTQDEKIKLVYTLERPSSVLIDAVTGKLITGYYDLYSSGAAAEASKMMDSDFTPVENKEVEITKNCISKEAAVNIVKKYISIPASFKQRTANLYEDYDNPEYKIWSIEWEKTGDSGENSYIYARVNAITSELLSFDIYDYSRGSQEFKQKYNRAAAQQKAEEFLQKYQPERFESTILEEINEVESPEKVKKHYFTYTRLVNDIPYTANGFNITVDAETGNIISYRMNWHNKEFPSAEGVLEKSDVETRFLNDIGLEVVYTSLYNSKDKSSSYKLVYKVKPAASYTFDAFDFKPLDSRGKPIKEETKTAFTDIKGHWAEKDIQLLVDLGILKSKENLFRPDEAINEGEFIKLLLIAKGHQISDDMPLPPIIRLESEDAKNDDEILKYLEEAEKLDWVKAGEASAQNILSREKAAAFVVRAMGFEKIASISDIYKDLTKDSASIKPEYKGHTAIAMGLKLLSAANGNFNPKGSVSRAEAATILVRMLKASS